MSQTVSNIFTVSNGKKRPLIMMSGYVGGWRVNSNRLFEAIRKMEEDGETECDILINSGGGSTMEGFTIGEYLEASPIKFHATVTGLAASMAGVILQFCDSRSMYKYARVMTHRVKGYIYGEVEQVRAYADLMVQEEEKAIDKFIARTGKDKKTVKSWMKTGIDLWFNATKAKANNLVDKVIDTSKKVDIPENATHEQMVQGFSGTFNSICQEFEGNAAQPITKNTNKDMKTRIIGMLGNAGLSTGLTENATDEAVLSELKTVINLAQTATKAQADLQNHIKGQGEALVNAAAKAGKIGPNEVAQWLEDYMKSPKAITTALSRMPGKVDPSEGLQPQPVDPSAEGQPAALKGRENWNHDKWMDEDPKGYEKLHDEHPEAYEKIFNAQFNTEA